MPPLPDDALVVRGGLNSVELLEIGSGVTRDGAGNLQGVSVNSGCGGHPDLAQHQQIAGELTAYLQTALHW